MRPVCPACGTGTVQCIDCRCVAMISKDPYCRFELHASRIPAILFRCQGCGKELSDTGRGVVAGKEKIFQPWRMMP